MGNNKKIAVEYAKDKQLEVIEFSPGSKLRVFQFFIGKNKLREKAIGLNEKVGKYSEINIFGPIWANKPAPALFALLNYLDLSEKKVRCHFTFTQDYGATEGIVKNIVSASNGILEDVTFTNISADQKIEK